MEGAAFADRPPAGHGGFAGGMRRARDLPRAIPAASDAAAGVRQVLRRKAPDPPRPDGTGVFLPPGCCRAATIVGADVRPSDGRSRARSDLIVPAAHLVGYLADRLGAVDPGEPARQEDGHRGSALQTRLEVL